MGQDERARGGHIDHVLAGRSRLANVARSGAHCDGGVMENEPTPPGLQDPGPTRALTARLEALDQDAERCVGYRASENARLGSSTAGSKRRKRTPNMHTERRRETDRQRDRIRQLGIEGARVALEL